MPMVTRSGDQIGVDRAAIDFAIANISHPAGQVPVDAPGRSKTLGRSLTAAS